MSEPDAYGQVRELLERTPDDQLQECIAQIKQAQEAVTFHSGLVTKHGKESIQAALKAGEYLCQAEIIVKGRQGWIKWCEETFPQVTYKTLYNYMVLYQNWKHVSNEDKEACETLRQAYIAAQVIASGKPDGTDGANAEAEGGTTGSRTARGSGAPQKEDYRTQGQVLADIKKQAKALFESLLKLQDPTSIESASEHLLPIRLWLKTLHTAGIVKPLADNTGIAGEARNAIHKAHKPLLEESPEAETAKAA